MNFINLPRSIREKADFASEFLNSPKAIDKKLKIKFEVIRDKIKEIEGKIAVLNGVSEWNDS